MPHQPHAAEAECRLSLAPEPSIAYTYHHCTPETCDIPTDDAHAFLSDTSCDEEVRSLTSKREAEIARAWHQHFLAGGIPHVCAWTNGVIRQILKHMPWGTREPCCVVGEQLCARTGIRRPGVRPKKATPQSAKRRRCLRCERAFQSESPHYRLCVYCRQLMEARLAEGRPSPEPTFSLLLPVRGE